MKLSLIINTCADAPHASEVTGSASSTTHARRSYALENFILPMYVADPAVDEVIVVGEWHHGRGYTYVESPSEHRSAVDALTQRQRGFEVSTGSVLGFLHDDHILRADTAWSVKRLWRFLRADVIVPYRYQRYRGQLLPLVNGMEETGDPAMPPYVGGHAAFYSREILEAAPWGDVEKVHVWDTAHTRRLREAGARIIQQRGIEVYDVEFGDHER